MAIRGENIGTAYIRILADGDGFDRSVREQMKDVDWEKHGRASNDEWMDGWREQANSTVTQRSIRDAIGKPLARGKWLSKEFFEGGNWKEFLGSLRKEYGDAGERAGEELNRRLAEGMTFDQLEKQLDDLTPLLVQKQKEVDKELAAQRDRDLERHWRDLADKAAELQEEEFKNRLDMDRDLEKHWRELADEFNVIWNEAHEENERRREADLKHRLDLDKQWELHIEDLIRKEREAEEEMQRLQRLGAMQTSAIREDERRERMKVLTLERAYAEKARRETQAQMELQRLGAMQAAAYREDERRTMERLNRELSEAYRINQQYDRQRTRQLAMLRENLTLVTRETEQLARGMRGAMSKGELNKMVRDLRVEMDRIAPGNRLWNEILSDTDVRLRDLNPRLNRTNIAIRQFSDLFGKAFGHGSRNDFLNFIGSFARGIGRIPLLLTGTLDSLTRSISRGTLLKDLSKMAAGVGGVFAGMYVMVGPLLSILSMAAGLVAALASSIAMGLVGALGALAGALAPVIAGLGVTILAFQNMPKEAKTAFKSLKSEFKGLGEVAGEAVFGNATEQAERFKGILGDMETPIRRVGLAISRVGDYWLDLMEGKAFKDFRVAMERFLPGAVESLGRALGDFFGGMGGVLRALLPLTERFLTWIERSARRFNEWANGTWTGQMQMLQFFRDAGDAAAELGGFLGSVNDLFWTLVRAGDSAGNSLFGTMTDKINGWVTTLRSNPDILRDWYDSAESFGEALGRVVVGLGKVFSALDNDASRAATVGFFNALAGAITLLADALTGIGNLFGVGADGMGQFAGAASLAMVVFPKFNAAITTMKTQMATLGTTAGTTATKMQKFGAVAGKMAGPAGFILMADSFNRTNEAAAGLEGAIGGALTGAMMFGPGGAIVGAIVGGSAALYSATQRNAQALADQNQAFWDARKAATNFADALRATNGAIDEQARKQALLSLQNLNVIDETRTLGLEQRTVVEALLGNEAATRKVAAAIEVGKSKTGEYVNAASALELALFGVDGQMGLLGVKGQGLTDTFKEQRDAILEEVLATGNLKEILGGLPKTVRTQVAALGTDTTIQDVATLALQYDLTPKQVQTIVGATGVELTKKQVQNVRELIEGMPKEVNSYILAHGAPESAYEVATLGLQYDLLPKQVSTLLKAAGIEGTLADVKGYQGLIKALPDQAVTKINALGAEASIQDVATLALQYDLTPKQIKTTINALNIPGTLADVRKVQNELDETGRKKPKPKVDLDPTPFNNKNAAINRLMLDLGGKKPTPKADLNPALLNDKTAAAIAKLRDLDTRKPKPVADLQDKVTEKVNELTRKMNIFGDIEKTPKVGIKDLASNTLRNIQTGLNLLQDKTVTVTTNYRTIGAPGSARGVATGGHITGPGTWTSDSIPAMLSNNEYVIKAAAVNKYGVGLFDRLNSMVEKPGSIGVGYSSGGRVGGGKVVNVGGMTVVSPSADSRVVAEQVMNRLAASGY